VDFQEKLQVKNDFSFSYGSSLAVGFAYGVISSKVFSPETGEIYIRFP